MATEDDQDIPESGAIFTFGKSKFGDNVPSKFWIRDDQVLHVACGDEHTALVSETGKLFTFGSNDWGQLGLGHNKPATKPSRVKALKTEKVKLVTCGRTHTIVATENGKLYTFGNNGDGQLGIGSSGTDGQNQATPKQLDTLSDDITWKMLSAGNDHSVALTDDGTVYVWGSNSDGQCGLGKDEEEIPTPTMLKLSEKIVCISCGYYHTAFVTASGHLLTCGESEDGKLGIDTDESIMTPQRVGEIKGKATQVSCGGTHTIVVTEDGKAYSFGKGANGQLGHGTMVLNATTPQQITTVNDKFKLSSCGENHSALVSKKGLLYTFGDGRHGKLALGEENFANQFRLTLVSRFDNLFVENVSCGGCHTLATARPKLANGHITNDNDFEEIDETDATPIPLHKRLSQKDHLRESMDLEGSIGARNRRREKQPDPASSIGNRVLPPLSSSFTALGKQSLPPLNSSQVQTSHSYDSGLKSGGFPIQRSVEASVASAPQRGTLKEEDEESSDVSVTDSEEEEDNQKPVASKQSFSLDKPRPVPRKTTDEVAEDYRDQSEASASEDNIEDDFSPEKSKPMPASRSKRVSYEDEKLAPIKKQQSANVFSKGKKLTPYSEDEEDEESENKVKTKEKSLDPKKGKNKKDTKPPSPRKKKSVGIFGKKTSFDDEDDDDDDEDEEDSEESEEEEDLKKKKKTTTKKDDKKKKKKKSEDEDDDELTEDDDDEEEDEEEEKPVKSKKELEKERKEKEKLEKERIKKEEKEKKEKQKREEKEKKELAKQEEKKKKDKEKKKGEDKDKKKKEDSKEKNKANEDESEEDDDEDDDDDDDDEEEEEDKDTKEKENKKKTDKNKNEDKDKKEDAKDKVAETPKPSTQKKSGTCAIL